MNFSRCGKSQMMSATATRSDLITVDQVQLIQSDQENCPLCRLRFAGNFFGAPPIVIPHSDAYPPVADRTAKTQNFGGVITAGEAVSNSARLRPVGAWSAVLPPGLWQRQPARRLLSSPPRVTDRGFVL